MNGRAKYWNERSKNYGEKIEGVLFKSFPLVFNKYLHEWMMGYILTETGRKKENLNILDLGCGYGRIASEVIKHNKKYHVLGIDISKTYVSIFNKKLKPYGKALVGDVRKLPFKEKQFDVVLSVTTLMYLLNEKDKKSAISEITRVLKKSGKFIFIEPNPIGQSFITLGGLLSKKSKNGVKLSLDYSPEEIEKLVSKNKWTVKKKIGMPVFTICLLPLLAIYKISPEATKSLLRLIKKLDEKLSWLLIPSLYIIYIGYEK